MHVQPFIPLVVKKTESMPPSSDYKRSIKEFRIKTQMTLPLNQLHSVLWALKICPGITTDYISTQPIVLIKDDGTQQINLRGSKM